ncbi:MAG: hypothetical protein ACI82G_002094 [Bradymonadia bacterium]|jgi:hypothetical protein
MSFIHGSLSVVAVCAVICALPSLANASDPAEASAPVAELTISEVLNARHTVPTREQLEAGVPDAEGQLISVATNDEAAAWARQRAISLLSLYTTPASMQALGALTHSEDADVRAMSLYTLSRTFPDVGPQLLVLRLELVARTDSDERVVGYAIRSLRWIDAPAADAALARLAVDGPNPGLASTMRERRDARTSRERANMLGE